MRNSGLDVLHYGPFVVFHFAMEYTTYPILPTVKINTQTMRCETSAHYNVSQRPPPNWR